MTVPQVALEKVQWCSLEKYRGQWEEGIGYPELRLPFYASAGELLDRLDLHTPPVDPERIAVSFGYRVGTLAGQHWDVAVFAEHMAIVVKEGTGRQLRRFAVAHALGHAVLHGHLSAAFADDFRTQERTRKEAEANAFALDLLLPRNWVVARIIHGSSQEGQAAVFDVPLEVYRDRLASWGL